MKSAVLAALLLFAAPPASAAVPQVMNYQGRLRLTAGAPVADSNSHVLQLAIYNVASGGTALWSETQNGVTTTAGLFNVQLGSVTPLTLPFDQTYWLGVNLDGDGEMSPRTKLSTAPYAFRAAVADSATVAAPLSLTLNAAAASPFFAINPSGSAVVASGSNGVSATGSATTGVWASGLNYGVYGISSGSYGVYGQSGGGSTTVGGVNGNNTGGGSGVVGQAQSGMGVYGTSNTGEGVHGESNSGAPAVHGVAFNTGYGVQGHSNNGTGIYGDSSASGAFAGVQGVNFNNGSGVLGTSSSGIGGSFSGVTGATVAGTALGLSVSSSGALSSALFATNNSASVPAAEFVNQNAGGSPLKVNALRFPSGPGAAGQVLSTDGFSQMNWAFAPAPAAPLSLTLSSAASSPLSVSNAAGTAALFNGNNGIGVFGGPLGISVVAAAPGAVGVQATVSSTNYALRGINNGAGIGVLGTGLTGTAGAAAASGGVGVWATSNGLPNAIALHASGDSVFDGVGNTVVFKTTAVDFSGVNVLGLALGVPVPLSLTGSLNGGAIISGTNNAPTGYGLAGQGAEVGVSGTATLSGTGVGVLGQANSSNGAGVQAVNSGSGPGLLAQGQSLGLSATAFNGVAVYGRNDGPGGFIPAARFEVINTNHAVEGRNLTTGVLGVLGGEATNNQTGVFGMSPVNFGKGLFGQGGSGYGVYGEGQTGVYGHVSATGQVALWADQAGVAGSKALRVSGDALYDGVGNTTTFVAGHTVNFSGATVLGLPLGVPVPLTLVANVAYPGAVLTATNTGSGYTVSAFNTQPGAFSGGSFPTYSSAVNAALRGWTGVSNSAGVAGYSEITFTAGLGVMGIGMMGVGGFGRSDLPGAMGGNFVTDSPGGWGVNVQASQGTGGSFNGLTGVVASGQSFGLRASATDGTMGTGVLASGFVGVSGTTNFSNGVGVLASDSSGGFATALSVSGKSVFNGFAQFNGGSNLSVSAPLSLSSVAGGQPALYVFNGVGGSAVSISAPAGGGGALVVRNPGGSSNSYGVLALADGGANPRAGLVGSSDTFFTNPPMPTGVYGFSQGGAGVAGLVSLAGGVGVLGKATVAGAAALQADGFDIGLTASASSVNGTAVYGASTAASGSNYGVVGQIASNTGAGVLGRSTVGGINAAGVGGLGVTVGVSGTATGTTTNTYGVFGQASTIGLNKGYGVYGSSNGGSLSNGYGVAGSGPGGVWGDSTVAGGNGVYGSSANGLGGSFQGLTAVVAVGGTVALSASAANSDSNSGAMLLYNTESTGFPVGLRAMANNGSFGGTGVYGVGDMVGVLGQGSTYGVMAQSTAGGDSALYADSATLGGSYAIKAKGSAFGLSVTANSSSGAAVYARGANNNNGMGVVMAYNDAGSNNAAAVYAQSGSGIGVLGSTSSSPVYPGVGAGLMGFANVSGQYGLYAANLAGTGAAVVGAGLGLSVTANSRAAYFRGAGSSDVVSVINDNAGVNAAGLQATGAGMGVKGLLSAAATSGASAVYGDASAINGASGVHGFGGTVNTYGVIADNTSTINTSSATGAALFVSGSVKTSTGLYTETAAVSSSWQVPSGGGNLTFGPHGQIRTNVTAGSLTQIKVNNLMCQPGSTVIITWYAFAPTAYYSVQAGTGNFTISFGSAQTIGTGSGFNFMIIN